MRSIFSLAVLLAALLIVPKIHIENIIYESIFYSIDTYFEFTEALEHHSLGDLAVKKSINLYYGLQEQAGRAAETLIPLYRNIKERFYSLNKKTESDSDIDKHKSRFNFASLNGGAKIVRTKPSVKIGKSILTDDDDNYALYDCTLEPLEIVVSLTEDVLVDTLLILNLENHASYFKDFEVLISTTYETQQWLSIGIFQTAPKKGWQKFNLPQKWARYIKLVLFSHHGSESLCTITQIKVLGVTMLENFRDEFLMKDDMLINEMSLNFSDAAKQKPFFPMLIRERPSDIHYTLSGSESENIHENPPLYLHLSMSSHLSKNLPLHGPYSDFTDETCEPHEFLFTVPQNFNRKMETFGPIPNYESINLSIPIPTTDQDLSDDICYVYEFFVKIPKRSENTQNYTQTISKIDNKEILENPQTFRKFRSFVSKMLTHLFQVQISPPPKKSVSEGSTQLVQTNNYLAEMGLNIQNSYAYNVFSQERKVTDPNESIFKTLSKRIKGLERSVIYLELLIEQANLTRINEVNNLRKRMKTLDIENLELENQINNLKTKNRELETRLENLEKTVHDINSPDHRLSNLSLIILLFLVLNIVWKILEKAAFSPVEPQQRWNPATPLEKGMSSSSKELLTSTKPSIAKKKSRYLTQVDSGYLSPALSNSNSMGDLHSTKPNRAKSPLSGTTLTPASINFQVKSKFEPLKFQ